MRNPLKIVASEFLLRDPIVLLFVGTAISLLACIALFLAAKSDGVLHISGGTGFLENYGLVSTLIGNAVFPYLARMYHDQVHEISRSTITVSGSVIQREMLDLGSMIKLEDKYAYVLYFLMMIGSMFWVSNVSFHIFGDSEMHWGHVFDSLQHKASFYANRINNIYTWPLLVPFCGYVVIVSSIQLVRAINKAAKEKSIRYDLLNPDKHGGFSSVERTHVTFNILFAIVYLQIILYTATFSTINFEHALSYIGLTLIFLFGNSLFFGGTYRQIKRLRFEALNACKERAYSGDSLQFQILTYCYELRPNIFSILNWGTKIIVLIVSVVIKFLSLASAMAKGEFI